MYGNGSRNFRVLADDVVEISDALVLLYSATCCIQRRSLRFDACLQNLRMDEIQTYINNVAITVFTRRIQSSALHAAEEYVSLSRIAFIDCNFS